MPKLSTPVQATPETFTTKQAAEYLGISVGTLYNCIYKTRQLRPLPRTELRLLFDQAELERFKAMRSNRHRPEPKYSARPARRHRSAPTYIPGSFRKSGGKYH